MHDQTCTYMPFLAPKFHAKRWCMHDMVRQTCLKKWYPHPFFKQVLNSNQAGGQQKHAIWKVNAWQNMYIYALPCPQVSCKKVMYAWHGEANMFEKMVPTPIFQPSFKLKPGGWTTKACNLKGKCMTKHVHICPSLQHNYVRDSKRFVGI